MTWFFGQSGIGGVLDAGVPDEQLHNAFTIDTTARSYGTTENIPLFNFKTLDATLSQPAKNFQWGLYSQDTTSDMSDAEIRDCANSHHLACLNIQRRGMKAFTFPANDLMWVIDPALTRKIGQYDALVMRNITGMAAKYADHVGIQSQGLTGDALAFSSYIRGTYRQAQNAKLGIPFYGGLATSHGSDMFTAQQMADSWSLTKHMCTGYWINVNNRASVVADFFRLIS